MPSQASSGAAVATPMAKRSWFCEASPKVCRPNISPMSWGLTGRIPVQACHAFGQGEWARDADGDGLQEMHTNSCRRLADEPAQFLVPLSRRQQGPALALHRRA
jgi:hypothetical protein